MNTDVLAHRNDIDEQIAALTIDPAAADIVAKADAILAAHNAKVAALRAKRDEIDESFRVTAREKAEAAERQREVHEQALRASLVEHEAVRLQAIEQAQGHLRSFVASVNEAFAAHARVREIANQIAGGARVLTGLSPTDFASRMGGRIAGHLSEIRVPGALKGSVNRIGALELPNSSLYSPNQSWREREEAAVASAIEMLIEHGRRQ